jgi:hypothetical protein
MPNVHCRPIVSGHNKTILNKQNKTETTKNQTTEKSSECNKKDSCPLSSKCLTSSIVYQATVTRDDTKEEKTYV